LIHQEGGQFLWPMDSIFSWKGEQDEMKGFRLVVMLFLFVMFASPCLGDTTFFFGPEQFHVLKGQPITVSRFFSGTEGTATLRLTYDGCDHQGQGDAGLVTLNGLPIISPPDFKQQTGTIERAVNLSQNNELAITFAGMPGSLISLSIWTTQSTPPTEPTATLTVTPESITAGESAELAWNTTAAEQLVITPDIGSVSPSGSLQVSPDQTTTYFLTAQGAGGTTTAETTLTVAPPAPVYGILFDPYNGVPLNLATVGVYELTITGAVTIPNNAEVGVVVNNVAAHVENGRFIANNIPLEEGINPIKAMATDVDGNVYTAETQVLYEPNAQYITIHPYQSSGVVPFDILLDMDAEMSSLSSHSLSCEGPVSAEITFSDDTPPRALFSVPGLYVCQVTLVDDYDEVFQANFGVMAYSKEALDSQLQTKWDGMRQALLQGDTATALSYFSNTTRPAYERRFTKMADYLPKIAGDMQGIHFLKIRDRIAIYDLRILKDGTLYSQYLEFVLDEDGLWKIRAF